MTDIVERLRIRWEKREGAAARKISALLGEAKEAADEIERLRALAQQPLSVQEGWRLVDENTPRDKTNIIIAVPTKERDDFIVGEAYFDPGMSSDDGDWWWAGTSYGDYHGGPVSDINYHGPTHWQPLPAAPTVGGEQE